MTQEETVDLSPEYGPHLTAALICERMLLETDGVNSVIRIIDQVIITASGKGAPKQMPRGLSSFGIFLALKTGEVPGPCEIAIRIKNPDNEELPAFKQTVNLEPPAYRGINLRINVNVEIDRPGAWWFDVFVREKLRTRMPLQVVYLAQTR